MARWNKVVTLLAPAESFQDEAGAWHRGERVGRTVFCNEYSIGVLTLSHLRSSDVRTMNDTERVDVGMHNERMLQVRAMDYEGEDQVIYEGEEYEVMYTSGAGEKLLLTIGQKLSSR